MDDFLLLDRKIPQSDAYASVEDFDVSSGKKAPLSHAPVIQAVQEFKSPELCSLIFRPLLTGLVANSSQYLNSHHHALSFYLGLALPFIDETIKTRRAVAENQMTGVQAISFNSDAL